MFLYDVSGFVSFILYQRVILYFLDVLYSRTSGEFPESNGHIHHLIEGVFGGACGMYVLEIATQTVGYLYQKSPNLRHRQARSQNKGLSRASRLQTGPSSSGDSQREQPEPERGNRSPGETLSTKL